MCTDRFSGTDVVALGAKTTQEVSAALNGKDLNIFRAEQLERQNIALEAERYRNLDPSEWPVLKFEWDFSNDAQRFTLDGYEPDSFATLYPQGLRLGWVALDQFDAKLSIQSRRELPELWTVGDQGKLVMAIEYIHKGKPITPPLVVPLSKANQICLIGGNHRYTVAKFSKQISLPFYAAPEDAEAISAIITTRWV